MDGDGLLDLIAGDADGNVWFFRNVGTKTAPKLAAGVKLKSEGKEITGPSAMTSALSSLLGTSTPAPVSNMGEYSKLHVVDWDNDGLLDVLVGHSLSSGADEMVFYKNVGTKAEAKFAAPVPLKDIVEGEAVLRAAPYVADWDGDGKRDLLVTNDNGKVFFLRNVGTNAKPVFAKQEEIKLPGMEDSIRWRVCVVDWNNDGKLDLVVGNCYSGRGEKKESGGHVWVFLRK
jgi:large repetitive protein